MRLQRVLFRRSYIDDVEPRWIFCVYVGEGFLDLRIGRRRWRWFW